jgi:HSP20 family protein
MRMAFVRRPSVGSLRSGVVGGATGAGEATPARLDVVDRGDRYSVTVDLPGVSREDVNVAVEGARISVTGSPKPAPAEAAQIRILRSERRPAKYARTVELPAEVDGNAAEATLENGVLTLTLPKRESARQIVVR